MYTKWRSNVVDTVSFVVGYNFCLKQGYMNELVVLTKSLFTPQELKAQVNYSDHILSVVCLPVRLSVRKLLTFKRFQCYTRTRMLWEVPTQLSSMKLFSCLHICNFQRLKNKNKKQKQY